MKKVIVFLLILLGSCSKCNLQPIKAEIKAKYLFYPATVPELDIYIMAGQSNMAGRGMVGPEDTVSSKNVLSFDIHNKWYEAKEPLHYYENSNTVDCGLSFGKALNKPVGLVPCAVGGSSVSDWLNDNNHRGVKLYTNFENKVLAAKSSGTIKGILWHQGESDLYNPNYKAQLVELFSKFRKTTGNDSLKIYSGLIGTFKKGLTDSLNLILIQISKEDLNFVLVNTTDFKSIGDSLHFNSESQRLFGKRLAAAIKD